jgi:hypothetical protein
VYRRTTIYGKRTYPNPGGARGPSGWQACAYRIEGGIIEQHLLPRRSTRVFARYGNEPPDSEDYRTDKTD